MRAQKVIKYYRVSQWGTEREFIHPDCRGEAVIVQQLTGQKTIDAAIRELLRDLTAGMICWEQTLPPQKEVA